MNLVRKAVGAIIYRQNKFLFVRKTKISTIAGKEDIEDEWDFIKGGVKKDDVDLRAALLRELKEETGSTHFHIVKEFTEKLSFEFPDTLKSKIGYEKEETTMFLVQYLGIWMGSNLKMMKYQILNFMRRTTL